MGRVGQALCSLGLNHASGSSLFNFLEKEKPALRPVFSPACPACNLCPPSASSLGSLSWPLDLLNLPPFIPRNPLPLLSPYCTPLRPFCVEPGGASWRGASTSLLHTPLTNIQPTQAARMRISVRGELPCAGQYDQWCHALDIPQLPTNNDSSSSSSS